MIQFENEVIRKQKEIFHCFRDDKYAGFHFVLHVKESDGKTGTISERSGKE